MHSEKVKWVTHYFNQEIKRKTVLKHFEFHFALFSNTVAGYGMAEFPKDVLQLYFSIVRHFANSLTH
jgi:hypothetical protein